MADRREIITGIVTVSTVGIAGCSDGINIRREGNEENTEEEYQNVIEDDCDYAHFPHPAASYVTLSMTGSYC